MEKLSKTYQLGLIILGFQLLRNLKFSVRPPVTAVASRLGVSRKAGYEAVERVERALGAPPGARGGEERDLENARLRLRLQIVTFERDHRGVRFSKRRRHLPREAKKLCVRLFRDFRDQLSESEVAQIIQVPLSSLRRWDEEADPQGDFPNKPERRGTHRRAKVEDEERVIRFLENLKESLKLEEFTQKFNAAHPETTLDRKTISRILERYGKKEVKKRNSPKPYHDKVKVYFPGAQLAVDAKECTVMFTGGNEETISYKRETALDLATGTSLGTVLVKTEIAEGVERVLVKARQECDNILSVLADNRSANQAANIEKVLGGNEKVGMLFTFPYHPQTNGHIEGHFGRFSRIVGEITIDDTSRETIAYSVVEAVSNVFDYFHNNTPVEKLGGLTRREYLKRYSPKSEEMEEARKELLKQQARSRALREEDPRLSDPHFRKFVKEILDDHRFEVDLDRAVNALRWYDRAIIESASRAFYVQSKREKFKETKRTFAYFMGIVKKKQAALDAGRSLDYYSTQKLRRFKENAEIEQKEVAEEKAQERKDLLEKPEQVILEYSRLLLSGGLDFMRRTCLGMIRKGLSSLVRLGRAQRRVIEGLSLTIRGWGEFGEDLKSEMVDLLFAEYESLRATVSH